MVSCDTYQDCFDNDNIASINHCLNGVTHGPVHIRVGGEWNNPEEDLTVELGNKRCGC